MCSNPLRIVGNFVTFICYTSFSVLSNMGLAIKTVTCIAHKRLKVKNVVTKYILQMHQNAFAIGLPRLLAGFGDGKEWGTDGSERGRGGKRMWDGIEGQTPPEQKFWLRHCTG